MKVKNDHRSEFSNLSNWKEEACSISALPVRCSTPHKQAKLYPRKFHADNNLLFCSTCDVVVDHHRKSVLDKHLSAVSHIKQT